MHHVAFLLVLYSLSMGVGLYSFVNFQKLRPAFRWLGIYLFSAGIIQLAGYLMVHSFEISNTGLFNVAVFVYHFLIFMFFFKLPVRKSETYHRILIVLFILSAVVMMYLIKIQVPANWFSFKAIILGNFVYSVSAMLYLLDTLGSPKAENPMKSSRFISLLAILFYFSTSAVYFSILQLFSDKLSSGLLIYFNLILMFIFYAVLFFAMTLEKKQNQIHGI